MAIGRRCDVGCLTWPDDKKYAKCPVCGEPTTRYSNLKVADADEINETLFDVFYKEWDERQPASRLLMTPEEALVWDQKYPDGRPDPSPDKVVVS